MEDDGGGGGSDGGLANLEGTCQGSGPSTCFVEFTSSANPVSEEPVVVRATVTTCNETLIYDASIETSYPEPLGCQVFDLKTSGCGSRHGDADDPDDPDA